MADVRTLNEFYNELRNKGAKLSHNFQISIFSGIPSVDDALKGITMWVQGAEVPGRTQNFAEIPYLGYTFQMPTNMTMTQELALTFNCDGLLTIRDALLFWHGTVSDPDIEGGSASGGNKRMSNARIILDLYNDKMDTITNSFELEGVFPADLGVAATTNADPEIMTFDCTFTYQYWKTLSKNTFK